MKESERLYMELMELIQTHFVTGAEFSIFSPKRLCKVKVHPVYSLKYGFWKLQITSICYSDNNPPNSWNTFTMELYEYLQRKFDEDEEILIKCFTKIIFQVL